MLGALNIPNPKPQTTDLNFEDLISGILELHRDNGQYIGNYHIGVIWGLGDFGRKEVVQNSF